MIEVEKKFQPTEEKLKVLLSESVFLKNVLNHDIYYDFSDFRLIKKDVRFRLRNTGEKSFYELKVRTKAGGDDEIEDEEEIKRFLKTELDLKEFIEKNLILFMDYKTERQKYKNGEFKIDIDRLISDESPDFVFNVCEIELQVKKDDQVPEALIKIKDFATKYGMTKQDIPKRKAYLKAVRPEIYKQIINHEE